MAAIPNSAKEEAKKQALVAELTGKDLAKMDDLGLYSELLVHYKTRDERAMKNLTGLLIKKYPQSSYADNALYLTGELNLELRNYAEALKNFQQVLKSYPQSNRAVAAYFSKGIAYKKMNLDTLAKKVFFEVRKKYPGSPEFFRAETELKLFK